MPRIGLTDISIRSLSRPPEGQIFYFDKSLPGFCVRCSQGGAKTFVVLLGPTRRRITIGRYPIITLAEARSEAKRILAEHTLGRARPHAVTFDEAKKQFLDACRQKNAPRTVRDYERLLGRHFRFARTHLSDITKNDIQHRLDRLKRTPSEQNHAFVALRGFLRWCVRSGYIERSPLEYQQLPAKTVSRDRVLTASEVAVVYKKAREYPYPFGTIVSLLVLTGQRRGEVAALEWDWIEGDIIALPAHVTKNRKPHTFPLGTEAMAALPKRTSDSPYLFPAARSHVRGKPTTVFNGWTRSKPAFDTDLEVAPYTLHDLRRTFSSNLAILGVPLHVTEKLLNHASGS